MAWSIVLPKFTGALYIEDLCIFNGKLYAATGFSGKLLEWDGVASTWTEVADSTESIVLSLAIFNDKLYGGTFSNGNLIEWNGVDAWTQKAPYYLGQSLINRLLVFNDKLYGVTSSAGNLFEWNGVNAWIQKAPQLAGQIDIWCTVVYNGKIYAGTKGGAKLFEWNGVDAWVEKAAAYLSEIQIKELIVYDGELYGFSGDDGYLLKWNGVDAWTNIVQIPNTQYIARAFVYDDKIYFSGLAEFPDTGARLWSWDGSSLIDLTGQNSGLTEVRALIMFNNMIYAGGSGTEESALYYSGVMGEVPPPKIDAETEGDIWLHLENNQGNIEIVNNDLRRDPTLENAIEIALFTDRRAEDIDTLPDTSGDKRGWWGDDTEDIPMGSKLWLLSRSKTLDDIPSRAEQYIREALQFMIDTGVVDKINISAQRVGQDTLEIIIIVIEPQNKNENIFKYYFNWRKQSVSKGRT